MHCVESLRNNRPAPCKGCQDREPGCSEHCRKPEYLAWRAELEKIRENRRKYRESWAYTAGEILKNRGVK